MSALQARVKTEGEVVVVKFSGRVDVESAPPFRRACETHLCGKKVVFDFEQMSFVGSTGILPFLEAMQDLAKANPQFIKFSGVGIEFRRVLSATSLAGVEVHDSPSLAVHAFAAAAAPVANAAPTEDTSLLSLKYETEDISDVSVDGDDE